MAYILPDDKGRINPIEIKEEREEFQRNEIVDLPGLLKELKFLEDTFLKTEIKLGTITDKWQSYFEDDISCNFNLIKDWMQSIKSCLDEITQKYRDDFAAPPEYFHNLELPLKLELRTGEDDSDGGVDNSREEDDRKPKPHKQELPTWHDTNSGDEQSPPADSDAEQNTNYTPPPHDIYQHFAINPASSKRYKVPLNPETFALEKPKRKRRNEFDPPPPPTSECPICHKVLARGGLTSHIKRCHEPHDLKFSCPQCPSHFHTNGQLKSHMVTHSDTKSFVCQTCGWAFHQYSNMLQHMKRHSEERPLKCDMCDATFKYSQALRLHIEAKHSTNSNQCPQCGKMFTTGMKLKRHEQQVHQSVRKHSCLKCDKVFKRVEHLRYHEKTHDNPNTKNRGLNKAKE
ncbi:zinc finger protein 14 isoform X2 [Folsomia candida]|uniref:zinc finger protein 14 isoform X2 n=1 Tax=Folsomia candida TaxID=158441 RepID=UPI000B8FF753|nr:zinc finger protein 14 isoform X2 [Folsomia candida]